MRRYEDLDGLSQQLADFQARDLDYNKKLQDMLKSYSDLLEDYGNLQSDYEEERAGRERYKRLAKANNAQPYDQYVLMLVDGHECLFHEDLIRAKREGGAKAAELLEDGIKASLPPTERGLPIVVKIYADMASLSRNLARLGWGGQEDRTLLSFAAAFNQSRPLFDFVDSGDTEGTRLKIQETFHLFANSGQCKRVIFAACHDATYLNLLSPYSARMDKLTLVQSASWEPRFKSLKVAEADFRHVFTVDKPQVPAPAETHPIRDRSASVRGTVSSDHSKSFTAVSELRGPQGSRWAEPTQRTEPQESNEPQSGRYRADPSSRIRNTLSIFPDATRPRPADESRSRDTGRQSKASFHASGEMAEELPMPKPHASHLIPINRDDERLDTYIPTPSESSLAAFFQRAKRHKVCNAYHLGGYRGGCEKGSSCPYDHSPVNGDELDTLRYLVRQSPCPRSSSCRTPNCSYGHVCTREECRPYGKVKQCRLDRTMHGISLDVDHWELPVYHKNVQSPTQPRDINDRGRIRSLDQIPSDPSPVDQGTAPDRKRMERFEPSEHGSKIPDRDEHQQLNQILIKSLDGNYDDADGFGAQHGSDTSEPFRSPARHSDLSRPNSHSASKIRDDLQNSLNEPRYELLKNQGGSSQAPLSSRPSRIQSPALTAQKDPLPGPQERSSSRRKARQDDEPPRNKAVNNGSLSSAGTDTDRHFRPQNDESRRHSEERRQREPPSAPHQREESQAEDNIEFEDPSLLFEASDWKPVSKLSKEKDTDIQPASSEYEAWGGEQDDNNQRGNKHQKNNHQNDDYQDTEYQHDESQNAKQEEPAEEGHESDDGLHQPINHQSEFDWLRSTDSADAGDHAGPVDPTPTEASSMRPEKTKKSKPAQQPTKQQATAEVGWGDYRDGTFDSEAWTDDPEPAALNNKAIKGSARQEEPRFDDNAEWGGEPSEKQYSYQQGGGGHDDRYDGYDRNRGRRGGGGGGGWKGNNSGGGGGGGGGRGSRRNMVGMEYYEEPVGGRRGGGRGRGARGGRGGPRDY